MSNPPLSADRKQRQLVHALNEYDVLLGRGQHVRHEGNLKFVALVRSKVAEYHGTQGEKVKPGAKDAVARQIIKEVAKLGGRFVKRVDDPDDDNADVSSSEYREPVWEIADTATILIKIKQTFRDYAVIQRKAASACAAAKKAVPVNTLQHPGKNQPPRQRQTVTDALAQGEESSATDANQLSMAQQLELLRSIQQSQEQSLSGFSPQPSRVDQSNTNGRLAAADYPLVPPPLQHQQYNTTATAPPLDILQWLQGRSGSTAPAMLPSRPEVNERPLEQHFFNLVQHGVAVPAAGTAATANTNSSTTATSLQPPLQQVFHQAMPRPPQPFGSTGTTTTSTATASLQPSTLQDLLMHQALDRMIRNERQQLLELERQRLLQQIAAVSAAARTGPVFATATASTTTQCPQAFLNLSPNQYSGVANTNPMGRSPFLSGPVPAATTGPNAPYDASVVPVRRDPPGWVNGPSSSSSSSPPTEGNFPQQRSDH